MVWRKSCYTFSHISPPQQVCLIVQSHAIVSVHVFGRGGGGGTKARICPTTWTEFQNGVLSLWSVMVVWSQTWSETIFVEPKMERKFSTEYSTAEKCPEVTITWTIRAWRSFTCVSETARSWNKLTTNWVVLNFVVVFCLTHDHENFEMCGVLNSNNRLWATMGPLKTFGNRVVVGWSWRFIRFR